MDGETITSPADLSASFDLDTSAVPTEATATDTTQTTESASGLESPAPVETGDPNLIDELNDPGEGETEDLSADQQTQEAAEEQPAEESDTTEKPAAEQAAEELPEGVRAGKDRNGKPGCFVEESRWKNAIYPAYQTFRAASELIGEPLSVENLKLRDEAYMAQERMFNDVMSGDAVSQANVLGYFFDEAVRSREAGEITGDPMLSFAEAFYNTLHDKSQDGFVRLRTQAAKDLIGELYQEAAKSGNKDLWLSMGHVAQALGFPYRKSDEMESFAAGQTDQVANLRQEVQSLKDQLQGRTATNQAAQFDQWFSGTKKAIQDAVLGEAVMPALSESQKVWEKISPGAFKDLVIDRLHKRVNETILSDARFNERIKQLHSAASRASAQRRTELGEQIKQQYINRARLAVDAHKSSVLKDAAAIVKERSDATHARRANGATHRAPGTTGTSVKRPLVPTKMDDFEVGTPDNLLRSLRGILQ